MPRKAYLHFKNQCYESIKNECLNGGKLFHDDCFKLEAKNVEEWLRPFDISKDPKFFDDGYSRFDVIQGQQPDCWLIVAMANLTMDSRHFARVVPKDQSFEAGQYCGLFRFRIWQCGDWYEVVVDDRLPTKRGQLLFAHSKSKKEFWSSLLEKAFAKVYGSYDQLAGGWFCESMVDLTGGMVETVHLSPPPGDFDRILISAYMRNATMCIYMKNDRKIKERQTTEGLVKGHAYSVTRVQYITLENPTEGKLLLVRLRNPWGKMEWRGAWSDTSKEWNRVSFDQKHDLALACENDGEFWMSITDLIKYFEFIDICHTNPTFFEDEGYEQEFYEEGEKPWQEYTFKGEWIKDVNAGGVFRDGVFKNPQFRFSLSEAEIYEKGMCTLIIALMQKNKSRKIWHRIGFTAIKVDESQKKTIRLSKEYILSKLPAINSPFRHIREIVVRQNWKPGTYCILPSTYHSNEEGQFLLRVFTEKSAAMEELVEELGAIDLGLDESLIEDDPNTIRQSAVSGLGVSPTTGRTSLMGKHVPQLVYRSDQEVKAFFSRISGKQEEIGWQGLQSILQYALSPNMGLFTSSSASKDVKFPNHECRALISMLDMNRSGKLDLDEFQTLWSRMRKWESIFLECSKQSEYLTAATLHKALVMAGYRVPSGVLGSLVKRHSDDQGRFTFNEFVMCAVELLTSNTRTSTS